MAPNGICFCPTEMRFLARAKTGASASLARASSTCTRTSGEICGVDSGASPTTVLAYATSEDLGVFATLAVTRRALCPDTGANATLGAGE